MEKEEKKYTCNECSDNCDCDEHCDHNHDGANDGPIIVEMEALDGEKVKVEIVATFDDSGKTYAIANDLGNNDNSYIFEVRTTKDGDMLISIEDEKEFERYAKLLMNYQITVDF